jgi:hypothetical protein
MTVILNQNMQEMKDEIAIMPWNDEYELMWLNEGKKICRRDILFEETLGMRSSLKELKMQYKVWNVYKEELISYYEEQEDIRNRWEEVFANDNGFVFDEGTWLKLLN